MKITGWAIYKTPTTFYAPPNPETGHNNWNYHDFLFNTFTKHYGNYDTAKGLWVNGDMVTITVPYELPVPMDYNILELTKDDSTRVYYVITGYSSKNDSNNPSMTINGTFDPWQNYISNKPYGFVWGNNEEAYVSTGTLGLWQNTTKPCNRIDIDAPKITHSVTVSPTNSNWENRPVIWAKIRLDDKFTAETFDATYVDGCTGVITRQNTTPIIYLPVGIVEYANVIKANLSRRTRITGNWGSGDQQFSAFDPNGAYGHSTFESSHILSVEYVCQVPFAYTYSVNDSTNVLDVFINTAHYITGVPSMQHGTDYILRGHAVCARKTTTAPRGWSGFFRKTNKPTISTADRSISSVPAEGLYAPVLKQMPYNFSFLKCNDVIVPVSYNDPDGNGVETSIRVDIVDVDSPFVTPVRSSLNYYEDIGKVVSVGAMAITKVDREELYNRNAGATEKTNLVLNGLKTVTGLAGKSNAELGKGVASGIEGGISYGASVIAMHEDLKNQQDIFSIPSYIGENRLQFLDEVLEVKYNMIDTREKRDTLTRLHRFGFGCNCYHPLQQNRVWFDFYKCAEVHADAVTNEAHRQYIESQFLSGVRVWYWYSGYSTTNPAITCDLNKNNPDVTIASF